MLFVVTHTDRAFSASHGFAGNLSTLWGMEVGHLCDLNSSGMRYMKEVTLTGRLALEYFMSKTDKLNLS
jgi:hypothetical protein